MARHIAIGDIHGCALALAALIGAIGPAADDTIITLGDVIDWGPDSRGVFEQLSALAGRCRLVPLRGNHEEMLLGALDGRSGTDFWLKFGGGATLRSYGERAGLKDIPPEHVQFVKDCRPFFETESHIFVHANYYPNRPMPEQPSTALYWESLQLERVGRHYSGKTVIIGHTPQKNGEVLDLGFLKCIDTFCHGGGWLTALEVNTGGVWQANQAGELR